MVYTHIEITYGGLMKLGIERDKIGDIIVYETGANILICSDIASSLLALLPSLTRFRKSSIEIITTNSIIAPIIKKEEIIVIIPSLRLDSIIAELAHTSRSKAIEIINSERVLVNFELAVKTSKLLNYGDVITIRGKGRFEINNLKSISKSGNLIVSINKYI